jgi:hypothetical protein
VLCSELWIIKSMAFIVGFYDNGVGHSFKSDLINSGAFLGLFRGLNSYSMQTCAGEEGNGWVTVENVLIRLNTTYTPNGQFVRYGDPVYDPLRNSSSIGYDAVACVELYEPWILETYNTSIGLPNSLKIVSKGNEIKDVASGEKNRGTPLTDVNRKLNSTAMLPAYVVAHDNSVNQMLKVCPLTRTSFHEYGLSLPCGRIMEGISTMCHLLPY